MKISVVTVSFNSAATIADTLRSVAGQTHADLEHVVVDGGSSDGTVDIVRRRGVRVAVFVSEPDRGIYDAMNKGLALATGEFVGFLNADDVFASPHALARIAEVAATGVDAVYGDLVYVARQDIDRVIRHWKSGPYDLASLRFGWMPPHPSFYARRALLRQLGGFDTRLHVAADYDLMTRCLTRPDIQVGYAPEVLVRMRLGGLSNASVSSIARKSQEDLRVIRRHGLGGWLTLLFKNLRKIGQFL